MPRPRPNTNLVEMLSSVEVVCAEVYESRFQLCPDDHRRRVWRRPGQWADPAFTIVRHTGPQQGVMVWGAICFEAEPLWLSLEDHLQNIGTSTTL
ncbi:transposable element Tc1 transposase [Trichonephila clavipes]|nr:transposable element Tc1 transposase [Trichonephila clavipes]